MSACSRESKIRLRRATTIPADAHVAHVDELSDGASEQLFALVSAGEEVARLDVAAATELSQYDLVKYTDYYRVDFA